VEVSKNTLPADVSTATGRGRCVSGTSSPCPGRHWRVLAHAASGQSSWRRNRPAAPFGRADSGPRSGPRPPRPALQVQVVAV